MSYKPGSGSGPGGNNTDWLQSAAPIGLEYTFALWFRKDGVPPGATDYPFILAPIEAAGSFVHFAIQLTQDGRLRMTEFNTNIIPPLGVGTGWHRIAYLRDVGASDQTQWVYVDGVLWATLTGNSGFPTGPGTDRLGIGSPQGINGAYRRLKGWTTVKAFASLDAEWLADVAVDRTGLHYELPLDTDLNDDSGSAHPLTIVGTVTQIADAPDLAFPRVMAVANSNGTTPGAGVALTMPAGIVAGELLLCWATNDAPSTTNMAISGWTQVQQTAATGTAVKHAIFAKLAAGGDTATLTGAAQDYVATIARIQNHGVATIATDIKVSTAATGTNAAPDPPSLNTGASKKYLWLASNGADDDDIPTTFPLEPTGFTGVAQVFSATGTTSCMQQIAQLSEAAQTKDPGAFKLAAAEEWAATTIAIPPAAAGGGIQPAAGSSAGLATVSGTARARVARAVTTAGVATVTGVALARTRVASVATAAGLATVTGTARAWASSAGSAAGVATATGAGQSKTIRATAGAAAGLATVAGTARARMAGVGTAAGLATVTGTARARGSSAGSAAGVATATGVSAGKTFAAGAGLASGSSTATGQTKAWASSAGLVTATSTAIGMTGAGAIVAGAGLASGSSTATGAARARAVSVGHVTATSTAIAVSSAQLTVSAVGLSVGTSTATAASRLRLTVSTAGLSIGTSTAIAYSYSPAFAETLAFVDVGMTAPIAFTAAGLTPALAWTAIGIVPRSTVAAVGLRSYTEILAVGVE